MYSNLRATFSQISRVLIRPAAPRGGLNGFINTQLSPAALGRPGGWRDRSHPPPLASLTSLASLASPDARRRRVSREADIRTSARHPGSGNRIPDPSHREILYSRLVDIGVGEFARIWGSDSILD